ncbi:hypothetical protein GTGU_04783 [Trabulsiella guamensis ATCC 49490]|uniref:Zinc finger DksA/TraR C4-type domain-containing protein n=1 Tax=Trabulsiella guamensis ATCC 49490 TaxID=1005994 RepID=A0A084Z0P9_9ENTR|nr:TraR/DksA C4-type zinc finger protein [Trabulsiella guamensis]KFB91043.1 hypothetical protein GTGU_04783 [Trabulsiella guamensis ATCC 49490]
MADELDRVSDLELAYRERALNAHLTRVTEVVIIAGHCNDCGEAIEPARLAAVPDVVTCIDCQQRRERRA